MRRGGVVLVLGGTGLLGGAVVAELVRRGVPFEAPRASDIDLSRPSDAASAVVARNPRAVVNAAGYTDVGRAEIPRERPEVFLLNCDAPAALARGCASSGVPLVHVSTDYVFDGESSVPYVEGDVPNPIQVYGASKLAGEQAVREALPSAVIARVSTLFGPKTRRRASYVDAVLEQVSNREEIEVVETPISSPTYAPDVAPVLLDLLDADFGGVVHTVNEGGCSRLELARAIAEEAGFGDRCRVKGRPEPQTALRRPRYSVLDTGRLMRLLGWRPRPWREALGEYLRSRAGGGSP